MPSPKALLSTARDEAPALDHLIRAFGRYQADAGDRQAYDSDVEPSGTSSASAAAKAGIPAEFADDDPDDPPTLREDGAPSPLAAAVQGRMPSQDVPEGRSPRRRRPPDRSAPDRSDRSGPRPMTPSTRRANTPATARPGTTASGRPAPRNRFQLVVRQATQFAVAASATLGVVVALSVLDALRKRLRR